METLVDSTPHYLTVRYKDIEVCYLPELDGGGMKFGQDYINFLGKNVGKVGTVYEWCAGPAFIGFSILAHGLCENLVVADINPKAVEALKETVRRNGLEKRVRVYLSDSLDSIPAHEKWDVVVSNPPHSGTDRVIPNWGPPIVYQDIGWDNHIRFYNKIGQHLNPNGKVIIQENGEVSSLKDFDQMIKDAGLEVKRCCVCESAPKKYYVWSEVRS